MCSLLPYHMALILAITHFCNFIFKIVSVHFFYFFIYCKRWMEVAGWKQGTTNEPQPEDAVLFFSFDGACERPLVVPLAFSRVLSPCLLVTSKITTRKTYIKECMVSTQNIDRATYRVQQHKHNVLMHSVTICVSLIWYSLFHKPDEMINDTSMSSPYML